MCTVSRATSLRNFWVWLVVVAPFVSVVPGYCSGESRNEAHACGQGTCGQTAMLRGSDGATETSVWDLLSFCTTSEMLSSFGSSFDSSDWGDFGTKETHNHAPRLREYRISMPLSLGEFSRGRDFTVARINEWEGSANAGPGVKASPGPTSFGQSGLLCAETGVNLVGTLCGASESYGARTRLLHAKNLRRRKKVGPSSSTHERVAVHSPGDLC
jgi:hypothetical protein